MTGAAPNGLSRLFPKGLPKLVMFDLDGTLLDSVPDLAAAVDSTLMLLGRPPAGVARVRDWVGNGAPVLIRRALAGQLDHSAVDDSMADEALALFMRAYAENHELTTVYVGVVPTLDWLKRQGVKLAVVTNKPEQFVAPLLEDKGLLRYFDWLVGGDTLPRKKPDPAPLLHVMTQAGVSPGESLFIGDSCNDILAGRAAGVPCIGMTYGYNHGRAIEEEEPDLVLDDLRGLLPG